jgi:NAD-dependent DNA ligase
MGVYTLRELCEYDEQALAKLIGPGNASNFVLAIRSLMANPIEDFKIIGALGFTNIAAKTWKIIFSKYNLAEFIQLAEHNRYEICQKITDLKGIGVAVANTIITEYDYFKEDIRFIHKMFNVIESRQIVYGKQIRFSGCRDAALEDMLRAMGHDADGASGVTKNTDILIVPYKGFESGKVTKAPETCKIVTLSEFSANPDKYL